MTAMPSVELIRWFAAVEIPALTGLVWLVWRTRRELDARADAARRAAETGQAGLAADLADHRLEVAKTYASVAYLHAVERRLSAHLFRIEAKLDGRPARPDAAGP
ncbi:MAG: hypothetical protein RID91_10135 [Azospirillaceae bacterium]